MNETTNEALRTIEVKADAMAKLFAGDEGAAEGFRWIADIAARALLAPTPATEPATPEEPKVRLAHDEDGQLLASSATPPSPAGERREGEGRGPHVVTHGRHMRKCIATCFTYDPGGTVHDVGCPHRDPMRSLPRLAATALSRKWWRHATASHRDSRQR